MIFITGDTHGEISCFSEKEALKDLGSDDYLIICGDFGFIFSQENTITAQIENENLDYISSLPFTTLFIDGTHENFERLNAYPVEIWNGGNVHRIREKVLHLMRGQVFELQNKRIFTMGGGISKYGNEIEKLYWWMPNGNPLELPSNDEFEEARANLKKHNYKVDLIITHKAPYDVIRGEHSFAEIEPPDGTLSNFLDEIVEKVEYQKWFCGGDHKDGNLNPKLYRHQKKLKYVWLDVIKVDET